MTLRSPAMPMSLLFPALLFSCGGKLVAEEPFALAAGQATLDWETPVPEGEASLWLVYRLSTASENNLSDYGVEPIYHIIGTADITTGGVPVYQGALRLDSSEPPTTAVRSSTRMGSRENCSPKGCEVSGRIRALELHELAPGSPLSIHAQLPLQGQPGVIEELTMQLRAK
jgi:hypothetical protein